MPSKVLAIGETDVVFGSEVGDDVAWSTESITDGNGRQSAHYDLGADSTARADRYRSRFFTQAQATPTLANACNLYRKTSDGTHHDNDDGTGDIALSSGDKLSNLTPMLPAIVDEAAANIEFVRRQMFIHLERYIAFVLDDNMGATITTDPAETKLILTPYPPEIA